MRNAVRTLLGGGYEMYREDKRWVLTKDEAELHEVFFSRAAAISFWKEARNYI